VANGVLVFKGVAAWPLVSLPLGLVGAVAVVSIAALLAKSATFDALRYCGENSIVIYLAFFLPMAATRAFLVKFGLVSDIGAVSAMVTMAGVIGALAIWWAVRGTFAGFLFRRPDRFRIAPRQRVALAPAE
jgi:uncharacterized membrane protein YcfT